MTALSSDNWLAIFIVVFLAGVVCALWHNRNTLYDPADGEDWP